MSNLSNLSELVRATKAAENIATEKTMVTALAVAFIAHVLETYEDQLTRNEIERARNAAFAACNRLESMGLRSTTYDLFLRVVETLEKGN